jgi:hypothetical protein
MDYLSVPQTTPCGHVFCYLCIYKWLEQDPICPQCRKGVDTAPYPVYILSNQVDQALLKYPDPTAKIRIEKELDFYKSFIDPWVELYSSTLFFGDNTYSSSSEEEYPIRFTHGIHTWQPDSDTSSEDMDSNSEPDSDGSNQDLTGREIFPGGTEHVSTESIVAPPESDDCSQSSNDESSDVPRVSSSYSEPEEQLYPQESEVPSEPQEEPERPRRSRRLRRE